ncbi:sodium-dependent transporter [candidate division KSB1 bacterium]|nr:sodium-dependent transporter [candidate division KSB1 bacterium]
MENQNTERGAWTSKLGFILAAAGSAIGLGNIWRFPYITGENGGAVFLMVYLGFIFLIGLPVMITELIVGRRTERNPVGALAILNPASQWKLIGGLGVLTGFAILSFYSVIAGWTVGYIVKSIGWGLEAAGTPSELGNVFKGFISNPWLSISYLLIFIFMTALVVAGGVKGGIERWCKILMPVLLGLLVLMIIRAVTLPGASKGIAFYLKPDFSKITGEVMLKAMGQAFFSLSLGMGAMVTYGSYLSKKDNLATSGFAVCMFDTLIAVMAGMAIFPALAYLNAKPDAGPNLIFIVLPGIFAEMPGGTVLGPLFFLLLAIAALTSTVSLLEVVTAYFVDEKKWSRIKAVWIIGGSCFLFAILSALSQNIVPGLAKLPILGVSFMDLMETAFITYSLPIGALFLSIFVGWIWGIKPALEEITLGNPHFAGRSIISFFAGISEDRLERKTTPEFSSAALWGIIIRFIAPIAIFILIVQSLNIPENYLHLLLIISAILLDGFLIWLGTQLFAKPQSGIMRSFLPPVIRFLALIIFGPIFLLIPYLGIFLIAILAVVLNYFLIKPVFAIDTKKAILITLVVTAAEIVIGIVEYFIITWQIFAA